MISQKGVCTQWQRKGICSRGDGCPWATTHNSDNRLRTTSPKGKGQGKDRGKSGKPGKGTGDNSNPQDANRPSRDTSRPRRDASFQQSVENFVEASRFDEEDGIGAHAPVGPRRLRGKAPSGKKQVESCDAWMKGECTNTNCDFWHAPECRNWIRGSCHYGDSCSFRHLQTGSAAPASQTSSDTDDRTPPRVRGNSDRRRRNRNMNREPGPSAGRIQDTMDSASEASDSGSEAGSTSEPDNEPIMIVNESPLNQ